MKFLANASTLLHSNSTRLQYKDKIRQEIKDSEVQREKRSEIKRKIKIRSELKKNNKTKKRWAAVDESGSEVKQRRREIKGGREVNN